MTYRVPIKIRKPIHKEYCECHKARVFTIEGKPNTTFVDEMSVQELQKFLDAINVCTRLQLSSSGPDYGQKVELAVNYGLPVTIETNVCLPTPVLENLRKVPHSQIQVSINFLDDFLRSRLEPGASSVVSLREMMSLAKSWKIFVSLKVGYHPHMLSRLDLFEMVDIMKNYIGHMLVQFPEIDDKELQDYKHLWEPLSPSCLDRFRQMYYPHVMGRTWRVKNQYKNELLNSLHDYVKSKKLSIELIQENLNYPRIRHMPTGVSELPLGIRPFSYRKGSDGKFVEGSLLDEDECPSCGKMLFN